MKARQSPGAFKAESASRGIRAVEGAGLAFSRVFLAFSPGICELKGVLPSWPRLLPSDPQVALCLGALSLCSQVGLARRISRSSLDPGCREAANKFFTSVLRAGLGSLRFGSLEVKQDNPHRQRTEPLCLGFVEA